MLIYQCNLLSYIALLFSVCLSVLQGFTYLDGDPTSPFLQYPDFYNFPPFFTIQAVESTREKQLALWRELLLRYHTELKIKTLIVHECPLWKNENIDRLLQPEEIQLVIQSLVDHGHGEWEDTSHTVVRILWRNPEQLATDIYQWAQARYVKMMDGHRTQYQFHFLSFHLLSFRVYQSLTHIHSSICCCASTLIK